MAKPALYQAVMSNDGTVGFRVMTGPHIDSIASEYGSWAVSKEEAMKCLLSETRARLASIQSSQTSLLDIIAKLSEEIRKVSEATTD